MGFWYKVWDKKVWGTCTYQKVFIITNLIKNSSNLQSHSMYLSATASSHYKNHAAEKSNMNVTPIQLSPANIFNTFSVLGVWERFKDERDSKKFID